MNTNKMALRRFTLRAAGGYRGREGDEKFVRELLESFGSSWGAEGDEADAGVAFNHSFRVVDEGKRTTRTVVVYWRERRVVIDVVDREMMLDLAWRELLHACVQMEAEPQYVVLTNQRDLRLYDLARDRNEARLTISLDEIPKYSEAFPFFRPDWMPGATPKIVNVDKVSKDVAELVGRVYRALRQSNSGRDQDVIRFTLQCIVAMFAEDIGLLPKQYFTTLLYEGAEAGDAEERLGALFSAMSTKDRPPDEIPYFNGGLFADSISLELGQGPLLALTKASEADWTFVDPHIFGSVFQGIMSDAERHASGAHYTAREDIMSVVGPTVIEPWRRRIDVASTLSDLQSILKGLASYRVLDPACGSGNFLYVAFRELYKLETEVLGRAYEFSSVQKGKQKATWISGIRTTNFFGIDNNRFAVELAKTTLNIAKKIAFEERKAMVIELYEQAFFDIDPSLPLDNLDDNIICADALFTDWPSVDAIVGNPPFLGGLKVRSELGADYLRRLQEAYPGVNGRADFCSYWFRRAHDHLDAGGRAGLVATNTVREGNTRAAATDYIVQNGGTITNAVSSHNWPGEAIVKVSMVNWTKGHAAGPHRLIIGGKVFERPIIPSHLRLQADVGSALPIRANGEGTSQGIVLGSKAFQVPRSHAEEICADPSATPFIRPTALANQLLRRPLPLSTDFAIDMSRCAHEASARKGGAAFKHLLANVKPLVESKGSTYDGWLERWWQPWRPRHEFLEKVQGLNRIIVCSRHAARPIFVFIDRAFLPTESLQLFGFDDDYSFGILQSYLHWSWALAVGSKIKEDTRYTSHVWSTFPWPQAITETSVARVVESARALLEVRDRLMGENGWSFRELYQAAEVAGAHPVKEAQVALDESVEAAYGKPADQEATEFLLEMNLCLAEDEAAGETVQGPGLPDGLRDDPRWRSAGSVRPQPLVEATGG